ncbi:hypothetical protein JJB09_02355 [Rhizobium sp. KVB221]|uniref:DUF2157 domain-containing protein n=2 Tax=Rhizobium setariae TaxID=2801340 RepID=A0A936YQB8_9HYPH|nr:hypothetical protein [Rhizobium setariae]
MMLTDADLRSIRDAGIIDDAKLKEISDFLTSRKRADVVASTPRFDLTHVLWYAGALIIIGAMGLFTNEAFNRMGGWALAACGTIYAVVFLATGHYLWRDKSLRVPAGLLIAVAVSMVPLIIYGIQDALDLWKYALGNPGEYKNFYPYVNGSWLYMEIGTIVAALIAIWRYPFPFILLVGGVALWFMSMDLAMWFTRGAESYGDWEIRRQVSLVFGLAMIVAAWAVDVLRKDGPDYPFWIHIFGVMAFWGGMTMTDGGTELQKLLYCLINIGLVGLSLFLNRRVYAVFGALGIATYLGYLASEVFQDVMLFSFALSAIGIAIIGLGLLLHRNRARLAAAMNEILPPSLAWLRPQHAKTG